MHELREVRTYLVAARMGCLQLRPVTQKVVAEATLASSWEVLRGQECGLVAWEGTWEITQALGVAQFSGAQVWRDLCVCVKWGVCMVLV